MKCLYHGSDLDGKMSAAIVEYFRPGIELIPVNYGNPFPWESFNDDNEEVYMVDFSLQPFEGMKRLSKMCRLYWIDHHETAIKDYINSGSWERYLAGGMQRVGIGACQSVWQYFTADSVPLAVQLLAHYDVWDHNWTSSWTKTGDVLKFEYGVLANEPGDQMEMIRYLQHLMTRNNDHWQGFIDEGAAILKYMASSNREYMKMHSYKTQIDGNFAIAVNKGLASSMLFDNLGIPDDHVRIAYCQLSNGNWTVSLYSKGALNVGTIAKMHGGGGHANAAGFQCEELPFKVYK